MSKNWKNFQKRNTKNSQSNHSIGQIEVVQDLDLMRWETILYNFKSLEQNEKFKKIASEIVLWKASGDAFFQEYQDSYIALNALIAADMVDSRLNNFPGDLSDESLVITVITSNGLLAYKSGSTIEEVLIDKNNYNNYTAVSDAVSTYYGNNCVAKHGNYSQQEQAIIVDGYNIGSTVIAVKQESTSRGVGAEVSFTPIDTITKTMTGNYKLFEILNGGGFDRIIAGDFDKDGTIDLVFTVMVSRDRIYSNGVTRQRSMKNWMVSTKMI